MAKDKRKGEIVTFKVDRELFEQIKKVPNRSEFIRNAILAALDNVCPLCKGRGVLQPRQKKHWEEFAANHDVKQCDECHELRLVCSLEGESHDS